MTRERCRGDIAGENATAFRIGSDAEIQGSIGRGGHDQHEARQHGRIVLGLLPPHAPGGDQFLQLSEIAGATTVTSAPPAASVEALRLPIRPPPTTRHRSPAMLMPSVM